MSFLNNKAVKRILWIMLTVSIIGLTLVGVTEAEINEFVVLVIAAVAIVSEVILYIVGKTKQKANDPGSQ